MPFPGTERRLRTRYKVRVPFTLKSNGAEVHGKTRNISLLGISAYSDSSVSQVQPVQCLLDLPQRSQPLIANGTVIRCEPLSQAHPDGGYEIGVFFKEFEGQGETDLTRFLEGVLDEERSAIRAGYRALKQRLAARKRRKKAEALRKRKRMLKRRRRKRQLERQKLLRKSGKVRRGRPPSKKRARKKSS
ncbi:MAG: PilZ domain-containing protein [Candidatus Omnitrophica bacterium]|nr:PilZ domain-containing protein [Candidatus Omnitrophota bacterium]